MNKFFGAITLSMVCGAIGFTAPLTLADTMQTDKFEADPQQRWTYVSDQVMGGVSQGQLQFEQQDGEKYARMSGRVSTENNGGFIQIRTNVNFKSKEQRGLNGCAVTPPAILSICAPPAHCCPGSIIRQLLRSASSGRLSGCRLTSLRDPVHG